MKERLKCPMCGRRWTVYGRTNPSKLCPLCVIKEREQQEREEAERREKARHEASYWWTEERE